MASTADRVRIYYHRPPDRYEIFEQPVVWRATDCIITLLESARRKRPIRIDGEIALEDRSPIVWFTFPGAWHDVGRFHLADGTFTGLYANILTPVHLHDASTWETTDLFLDVWRSADGRVRVLDDDEFEQARSAGWIAADLAAAARAEADRLVADAASGAWPPPIVAEWPLERAHARLVSS